MDVNLSDGLEFEDIELSLPVNAAYVTAARQTASSITGRLGFDADEIEDVKAAVSEACTFVIRKMAGAQRMFRICYRLTQDYIEVRIICPADLQDAYREDDFSLMLIHGLMEGFEYGNNDGHYEMVMSKRHQESSL